MTRHGTSFTCAYCGSQVWNGNPFCDLQCGVRWWRQKSTWWVDSIFDGSPSGPVLQPDQYFLDVLKEQEEIA